MPSAGTLNCPMCGAPNAPDATLCEHCGAHLATVACPSCFGLVFAGSKFCSHCGAAIDRHEGVDMPRQLCPQCGVGLTAVTVGAAKLLECGKCEGIWADGETLRQICVDREKQAAVLGIPSVLPESPQAFPDKIRYFPCPVCRQLMNRVNFANCSHVVVNVCAKHGTWFERDDLRRVVEFIRGGGLDQARARQIAELQEERRLKETAAAGPMMDLRPFDRDSRGDGLVAVAEVLWQFFR